MNHECTQFETQTVAAVPRWWAAIIRLVRQEIAYQLLVEDLCQLTPELLADIRLQQRDIRRFARAAVSGKAPRLDADSPFTTIGPPEGVRIHLLRLGSN